MKLPCTTRTVGTAPPRWVLREPGPNGHVAQGRCCNGKSRPAGCDYGIASVAVATMEKCHGAGQSPTPTYRSPAFPGSVARCVPRRERMPPRLSWNLLRATPSDALRTSSRSCPSGQPMPDPAAGWRSTPVRRTVEGSYFYRIFSESSVKISPCWVIWMGPLVLLFLVPDAPAQPGPHRPRLQLFYKFCL
jgi:hypothetical protein